MGTASLPSGHPSWELASKSFHSSRSLSDYHLLDALHVKENAKVLFSLKLSYTVKY